MLHQNGRYRVDVAADGAIRVQPGDWLSKYSAALHNEFTRVHEFARRDVRTGSPVPIANVDMIRAGETLYHLPTYYGSMGGMEIVARRPAPPMPDARKKQVILDALKRDFNLPGNNLPIVSKAIDIIGYADNAFTLAEIAGLIGGGGAAATAGGVLAIGAAILFPIGAGINLMNAWEFGDKLTGMRGVAYGTTAWAFGDAMPPLPANIRSNILASHGAEWLRRREKAWTEARDTAVRAIEDDVRARRVQKRSYQTALRATGDDNRNRLVKEIMKGFETQLTAGMQRMAFWSPEPNYPN